MARRSRPQAGGFATPIPYVSPGQQRADRALARAMEQWLDEMVGIEELNATLHARVAVRMQAVLHAEGLAPGAARRRAEQVMRAFENDRIELIRQAVTQGTAHGVAQRQALARAVFGDAGARRALRPDTEGQDLLMRRIRSQRMNGAFTLDRLPVRARLQRSDARVVDRISRSVESSTRLGESFVQSSQRLMRSTDITVALPRHIEEVAQMARTAQPGQLQAEIRRRLEALTAGRIPSHEITADTRRFLERVQRTGGADIDDTVRTWVQGRAQNQAMTIARTEGMAAQAQAYVESTQGEEWVKGYRWNLNPAHKRPDVCDVMASQDNYGLGPGGYPPDAVPPLAHPNDLCFFSSIVDDDHFARRRAIRNGEPEPPRPWESGTRQTGRAWLEAQPQAVRESILGRGRSEALSGRNGSRVVNADGSLNPLYHVERRPPPRTPEATVFTRRAGDAGTISRPRTEAARTRGT